MTEVTITTEDIPSSAAGKTIKVVKVSGQLDESNVDEKAQVIYQLIDQTPQGLHLVFDLENLEYMNSKSIGYLTDWYGKIFEGGGKVYLSNTRPNILDILQVVGLTQLIPNYPTLNEAKFAATQDNGTPAPAATPATPAQPTPTAPQEVAPATPQTPATPVAPTTPPAAPQPTEPTPVPTTQPVTPQNPAAPTAPAETPAQPAAPEQPATPGEPQAPQQ